jgi:RHS repeat-associated protein
MVPETACGDWPVLNAIGGADQRRRPIYPPPITSISLPLLGLGPRRGHGQVYHFDYGNRLRSIPGKEIYLYDGLGRRVQTTQADGSKRLWQYSHDGQMLFSWENLPVEKTHEYVYLAGSLVASIDHHWPSNAVIATKYQHTDALGSPVAVTNETGTVIERNDYEPYGAVIGKPDYSGIGYTGHVMDGATGLTYMQQRYYDQNIGRFLSVDPVTTDSGTGANFNRYKYASNNPYVFTDPDGRLDRHMIDGLNAAALRACSKSPPKRRSLVDEKEDLSQRRDSRTI